MTAAHARARRRFTAAHLLLLPPFVGLLWVGLYAKEEPRLWGFPFFYWYQLAWVPVGALLIALVHRLTRDPRDDIGVVDPPGPDSMPPYPEGTSTAPRVRSDR